MSFLDEEILLFKLEGAKKDMYNTNTVLVIHNLTNINIQDPDYLLHPRPLRLYNKQIITEIKMRDNASQSQKCGQTSVIVWPFHHRT